MVGNKSYLKQNTDAALKNNGISYALYRFEESLDIDFVRSLKPLVSN
jgi:hypothetical protein